MRLCKRLMDLTASSLGLLLLAPLFVLIGVAIKLDSAGPVFFSQTRIGQGGRPFRIFKFRSMVMDAENKGTGVFVKEGDERITRVGKLLRHTSLDEIPQLLNILRSEMSLVGPRPTLPYQVERYDARQSKRLTVKPGLTGWAQVKGRNALSWPERIELDLWYVDNCSLGLDLWILWKTLGVVVVKKDLYKKRREDPISSKPPGGRDSFSS